MKITRCEVCVGRKVINGLGGMEKKCYECKGVGHVELIEDEVEYLESVVITGQTDVVEEDMDLIPEEWVSETGEKVELPLATGKKKPGKKSRS